jgi:hypothetical protein
MDYFLFVPAGNVAGHSGATFPARPLLCGGIAALWLRFIHWSGEYTAIEKRPLSESSGDGCSGECPQHGAAETERSATCEAVSGDFHDARRMHVFVIPGIECADGYYDGIDRPTALYAETLTAFRLSDEILPANYGYRFKIRFPTTLGFKSSECVTAINPTEVQPRGHWRDRGGNSLSGI